MLSHGLVAAGLFFLVGSLYERIGVRLTVYTQGLNSTLPVFSFFWAVFLFANAGLPFLSGFASEFLGFLALFGKNIIVALVASLNFILGAAYAFIIQVRVLFGSMGFWFLLRGIPADLSRREFYTMFYLLF